MYICIYIYIYIYIYISQKLLGINLKVIKTNQKLHLAHLSSAIAQNLPLEKHGKICQTASGHSSSSKCNSGHIYLTLSYPFPNLT